MSIPCCRTFATGHSGTLVWRRFAGLAPTPPAGEAASTNGSSLAMPALERAAIAYAFYFVPIPAGRPRVRLDAAMQAVTDRWRTQEWSVRSLSELHLGSSRAQTAADDVQVIGRTTVSLAKGLAATAVGYDRSLNKALRSIVMDVSGEPESMTERQVRRAMDGYLSQGVPQWAAVIMAVVSNHPIGGQQILSGFEVGYGESLQAGQVGTALTPEQRRNQAIMLAVDVALTLAPGVGPALRGGAVAIRAAASGAVRLALATGISISTRMAPLLSRLGAVATRLSNVALVRNVLGASRGLGELGLRLNPLSYRVIFPFFAGIPLPLIRFAPLRRGLFIGFLRNLRATMPAGHLRAGLSRTIRMMETAGANWRGAYFQAERFLHYYYSGQLVGTELRMGARALGRRADLLLRNGLRIETKSWYYGWNSLGAAVRQARVDKLAEQIRAYLRRPGSRLLIEFEGSIPSEVLAELRNLAVTYNAGGTQRLAWTIIRPIP